MQLPDIRTLVLVANTVAFSMALVFAIVASVQRAHHGAVGLWTAAFLAKAVGLLLIYLRPSVPAFLSYPLANTLVVAAAQLFLAGLVAFLRRPRRWTAHVVVTSATLLLLTLLFAWTTYEIAVSAVTLELLAIEILAVRVLLRPTAQEEGLLPAQRLVVFAFAPQLLLLACRLVWLLAAAHQKSMFAPSLMTAVFYVEVIIGTILLGTALLFLPYRRADLAQQETIARLEAAIAKVTTLEGMLPICAWCKRIRDDDNAWHPVEKYVASHTQAQFSHSICPECASRFEQPGLSS